MAETTELFLDKTAISPLPFVSDDLSTVIADFPGPNPPLLFRQISGYLVSATLLHIGRFIEDGGTFCL